MPDETLLTLLEEVRGKTLRFLQGVDDEQALWSPPGLQNTILWHAGHCYILAEWLGLKALGREPHDPGGWFESFGWGSRPAAASAEQWPRLEVVVGRLVEQQRRLRHAIRDASDEVLDAPSADDPDRTIRFSIVHGLYDEACHSGEILLLRKMQGLGRPARAVG